MHTPQYQFNLGNPDPILAGNNYSVPDYSKLYKEWHSNITKEDLDNKIIMSVINFWFKDEDAGVGKVWNYFKNIG